MIECRGLSKHYGGLPVVAEVDLDVDEGEVLVLIGASGSGKTTTLKMLNRLIEPSAGVVRIAGEDTRDVVPHELRTPSVKPHGVLPRPQLQTRATMSGLEVMADLGPSRFCPKRNDLSRSLELALTAMACHPQLELLSWVAPQPDTAANPRTRL